VCLVVTLSGWFRSSKVNVELQSRKISALLTDYNGIDLGFDFVTN